MTSAPPARLDAELRNKWANRRAEQAATDAGRASRTANRRAEQAATDAGRASRTAGRTTEPHVEGSSETHHVPVTARTPKKRDQPSNSTDTEAEQTPRRKEREIPKVKPYLQSSEDDSLPSATSEDESTETMTDGTAQLLQVQIKGGEVPTTEGAACYDVRSGQTVTIVNTEAEPSRAPRSRPRSLIDL